MAKKKDEFDFKDVIDKLYAFLKYKLHFDDIQASTFIVSMFLLPISIYFVRSTNISTYDTILYATIGIDILVIIYSIIKFKYFRSIRKPLQKDDQTETLTINNIEQIDRLSGIDFERFVEQYYIKKGYKTELTQNTHDFGADIIADKGTESIVIEAKRWTKKISKGPIFSVDFAKNEYKANKAVIFTSSELTEQGKIVALKKGVKIIDRFEIKRILRSNKNFIIKTRKSSK